MSEINVSVVQQSAWDIPMDSMPLAAGYLKAMIDTDPEIGPATEVTICNFRGGISLTQMASQLFRGDLPDLLAFSVLGWNYRNFICLAETYKQLKPDGLVAFGGNHVANQAERIFREAPAVDLVVNGEGELAFRDLVRTMLAASAEPDLASVSGVSFRRNGQVLTTPAHERIENLDIIPSPLLTGAIPLTDASGAFRYEFALIETNRGCPYKCAFCYWGGAVGQRVRSFSRERLAAELDLLGRHKVETVFLCDANFGMLEADEEFVEDLVRTRRQYGYPRSLEANWAKNKSARFHRIVRELKENQFKSSFTLALQTLTDEALADMQRRNMRLNQWEDLVDWLAAEGLECYAELIWGAPGDTPAEFLDGYDRLARRVPRIATYPLLLLPNTSYVTQRELHGFVTVRGQDDDFEYVLANRSSTLPENLRMQRFMYLARILGENQYFKHLWRPARLLGGMSQSGVILDLLDWLDHTTDPVLTEFVASFPVLAESPAVARGHRLLYLRPELDQRIEQWWSERVVSRFPQAWHEFGVQLYSFARWSRPVYQPQGAPVPPGWRTTDDGYVSDVVSFDFAIADILPTVSDVDPLPERRATDYQFHALQGFYEHLDNHETGAHYFARPVRMHAESVGSW